MKPNTKEGHKMKDDESNDAAKLAACGVIALTVIGLVVLAVIAAVLYVLFNFGSFLGGL